MSCEGRQLPRPLVVVKAKLLQQAGLDEGIFARHGRALNGIEDQFRDFLLQTDHDVVKFGLVVVIFLLWKLLLM